MIKYYNSYNDDFVKSDNQNYELKKDYKWIHRVPYLLYIPFLIFSFVYTKIVLSVKVKNKKILKEKNFFIYANHTQALGDAFNPFCLLFPKKPKIIVASSNLGIKGIGKLLPYLGALPIPNDIHQMKDFIKTVNYYAKNSPIIIYPEAHVWPYNTFIREFPITSFDFPVTNNVPSYVMVTTYQKRKHFKKPKITVYFDGPFYPDNLETKKEKMKNLHDKVYNSMVDLSKNSTYSYIEYKKKD